MEKINQEEKPIVRYKSRDGQNIDLSFEIVKQYLVQGRKDLVTPQELFFFMGICKSKGLNPFKKDCYLIKYSDDPAAIVTSIDFYRSRAKAQKDCLGWKSGIIVKRGTVIEYREGNFLFEEEKLIGGWFEAQPAGWKEPLRHTVNLKPYIKRKKDGTTTRFWEEDNQPAQIQKVAESQGLRKLWPDEFQQIYYEGEILAEERDTTSELERLGEYGKKEIQMPKEKEPESEGLPSEEEEMEILKERGMIPSEGESKESEFQLLEDFSVVINQFKNKKDLYNYYETNRKAFKEKYSDRFFHNWTKLVNDKLGKLK